MPCAAKEAGGVYLPAPRLPQASRPRHPSRACGIAMLPSG